MMRKLKALRICRSAFKNRPRNHKTRIESYGYYLYVHFFPQIALAVGVLTSSWGVRVGRFCGFVAVGAVVTQGVVEGVIF